MIVCSAILIHGTIYKGRRHNNITNRDSAELQKLSEGYFKKGIQGFVDDQGKFLDRKEAAKHALECGQIQKLKYSTTKLFSEDIY